MPVYTPAVATDEEVLGLPSDLVGLPQAAPAFGISRDTIYGLARCNELPVPIRRVGRRYYIAKRDLVAWRGLDSDSGDVAV